MRENVESSDMDVFRVDSALRLGLLTIGLTVGSWLFLALIGVFFGGWAMVVFGLAWLFSWIPLVLILAVISCVKAFREGGRSVGVEPLQAAKKAKLVSLAAILLVFAPALLLLLE